ncbi:HD-GYP domain-containing protein [Azospira inquinata]|uniref:HD domain-containing protein n=1 Tax=Azospira inquinata TaxID=2785627 RepID=A0A975SKN6_9RHOO|nr:HD domain-containing phosphohydrolase [Azospira inquinata]QWT46621.1 HD domain-containing protein [Azospira inquinata]QWT48057.1 HD domain-containing protein [Azospira inquinata]
MPNLHWIILRRLLLAWLLLSAMAGGAVFYLESTRLDDYAIALATREAAAFGPELREGATSGASAFPEDLEQTTLAPARQAELTRRAEEFARHQCLFTAISDRQGRVLARSFNPDQAQLSRQIAAQRRDLPRDGRRHFAKLSADGRLLIQALIPLPGRNGEAAGYFEAVFLADPAEVARFNDNLLRTILFALGAVLITTLALYPVILALHRDMVKASREVLQGNLEMATVLGAAIAKRDSDTNSHNFRVTYYACCLGEALGLKGKAMRSLIIGAFLHDVGKIGISDAILLKPGPLTPEEFAIMRSHVRLGVEILAPSEWLGTAREVVEFHHERYDGSGYLQGLKGEAIPRNARIFAVADVFDALTSRRPYKDPLGLQIVLDMMARESGSHFDPAILQTFLAKAPLLYARVQALDEAGLVDLLAGRIRHYFFRGLLDPVARKSFVANARHRLGLRPAEVGDRPEHQTGRLG